MARRSLREQFDPAQLYRDFAARVIRDHRYLLSARVLNKRLRGNRNDTQQISMCYHMSAIKFTLMRTGNCNFDCDSGAYDAGTEEATPYCFSQSRLIRIWNAKSNPFLSGCLPPPSFPSIYAVSIKIFSLPLTSPSNLRPTRSKTASDNVILLLEASAPGRPELGTFMGG